MYHHYVWNIVNNWNIVNIVCGCFVPKDYYEPVIPPATSVCVGSSVSDPVNVISGVPQGSVLGPLLFVLYLNDLDCSPPVCLPKYADDSKLYNIINDALDQLALSNAIADHEVWCNKWQLPISINKCNVMHLGSKNQRLPYSICNHNLESVPIIKDLGVILSEDLKVAQHCSAIVKAARTRAIMISRCFLSRDVSNLVWAFKVYVRPILEYASPVWSPHLLKDIDLIESVQRRFTKFLPGMRGKSYKERLGILQLPTLELRRLQIDLVLTYALLHNLHDVDYSRYFSVRGCGRTRGHPFKLRVNLCKTDCRKYFYCNRVTNVWNQLPSEVVTAPSLKSFKKLLCDTDLSRFLGR